MSRKGKRGWGQFWPGLKPPQAERRPQKVTPAQLTELKELAALRKVDLDGEVQARYGVTSAKWLYRLQAQALIKELRDGTPR